MSDDSLQFDKAERAAATVGQVTCSSCGAPITEAYYSAKGRTFCDRCKGQIETALQRTGNFGRGVLFGVGGGIVGGVVYAGVAAISGYEIGLIAIVVGWLVGRGMQIGSGAVGGLRYQISAAVITYLAIAASYLALALKDGSALGGVTAVTLAFSVALPIIVGFSRLPGSLLSLLIIGIGIMQAWRMNRKPDLEIRGPFRIGPSSPAVSPPDPSSS